MAEESQDSQEKTEEPSQRKLEKAREVAKDEAKKARRNARRADQNRFAESQRARGQIQPTAAD